MEFKRKAYKYLLDWKNDKWRKPLIVRGARQVGKSTLIRQFSKEYTYFIEVNLEKEEYRNIFEEQKTVKQIIEILFLRNGIPNDKNKVLLFIDEIQESPKAIQLLRYFYEDFPELHVVGAGSLLEFSLKDVESFPVGRVSQFVLHPCCFEEFLEAIGKTLVLKEFEKVPVKDLAHDVIMELFHKYAIIGGMPEVIKRFAADDSYLNLSEVYDDLWQSYIDDVGKYSKNPTEKKVIQHIISSAPSEPDRISFAGFGDSNYKSREVGEAFSALDKSRLIQLVYPTIYLKPPLTPVLRRKPRLQFLDIGLLNHSLKNQSEMIGLNDLNDFYKGKIIQQLVTQELQSQNHSTLFKPVFWTREKATSNAEIDLVLQYEKYAIPIEIKSGKQGRLKSLHIFMEESEHKYAIRLLANKVSVEDVTTNKGKKYKLLNLPYYLASKLPEYAKWFVGRY